MALGRLQTFSRTVVQRARIERAAWPNGRVELAYGLRHLRAIQSQTGRELANRPSFEGPVERRQKAIEHPRIDDRKRRLVRLLGDQPTPDGIALRPEILALVVKTFARFVDRNPERNRIQPGGDAAVEPRCPSVECHGMEALRIAGGRGTLVEHSGQDPPVVVGRAANHIVVNCIAPVAAQPIEVRLEATAR